MVKINTPLFSPHATGDLGKAIQYVCGKFVKGKPKETESVFHGSVIQKGKFSEGAAKWSKILTKETKTLWQEYFKWIKISQKCFAANIKMNGYQIWISFWLRFGENGWRNYPNPPIE